MSVFHFSINPSPKSILENESGLSTPFSILLAEFQRMNDDIEMSRESPIKQATILHREI